MAVSSMAERQRLLVAFEKVRASGWRRGWSRHEEEDGGGAGVDEEGRRCARGKGSTPDGGRKGGVCDGGV